MTFFCIKLVKTGPSFAEAAMGRISQGTKVLVEGGYEKIFRQTFETVPEEQLQNSFACYLSTSAGPVMGVLYVSTAKLAFCSDDPLSYKINDQTEWSYYKVCLLESYIPAYCRRVIVSFVFWFPCYNSFSSKLIIDAVVNVVRIGA